MTLWGKRLAERVAAALLLIFSVQLGAEEPSAEYWMLYEKDGAFDAAPPETKENIEAGRRLYVQKCVWCHGIEGKGDGPAALGMGERGNPRPRDLTEGKYKVRSTPSGVPPTDEDIFTVLTRGMPGTSMLSWRGLPDEQLWQLVYYLKTLSPRLQRADREPMIIGPAVPPSYESLAKGRWLYMDVGCATCHGSSGRGDGRSAASIRDGRGLPLQVTDLTNGGNYKGGHSARDIYRTLATGFGGSAMPSYENALTQDQTWHLANFVRALSIKDQELLNLRQLWVDVAEKESATD